MTTRTYKAKPRAHISDDDAQRIGSFIERRFGDDPITPADLVAAARPKRSAIHRYFEWDDQAAANEHRANQARYLMRSIEVTVITRNDTQATTRAWHAVDVTTTDDAEHETKYVPAAVVWTTPDYSRQVITKARRELESWANRYEQYAELVPTVARVREISTELLAAA